jgi:DNA repair photolyase
LRVIEFPGRPAIEPCTLEYYDYTFAPYVGCQHRCLYCYAQDNVDLDWDDEIGVIPDSGRQLTEVLSGIPPQVIYVGGDTDPYQPLEAELLYTRQALELMAGRGFSGSALTKSDLFTRDIDILTKMPEPSVGISIAFDDEGTRLRFEADAPPTTKRMEALKKAKEAGITTYALVCPVLPHITDTESLIEQVSPFADRIWIYPPEMRSHEIRSWKRVESIMKEHYPDSLDEFKSIVFSSQHPYWKELRERLEHLKRSRHLNLEIFV